MGRSMVVPAGIFDGLPEEKRKEVQSTKYMHLCENHFDASQYNNPADKGTTKPRKSFRKDAVPTIFPSLPTYLQPNPSRPAPKRRIAVETKQPESKKLKNSLNCSSTTTTPSVEEPASTVPDVEQLDSSASAEPGNLSFVLHTTPESTSVQRSSACDSERIDRLTKHNVKLIKLLQAERVKSTRLRTKINECLPHKDKRQNSLHLLKEFVSDAAYNLISNEVHNSKKRPKQRRYTDQVKLLALAIKYQSSKCYRFLRKIFSLPSTSTLVRLTSGFTIAPGVFDPVIDCLKTKVCGMAPNQKLCIITLDEMSIKSFLAYRKDKDNVEGFVDYGEEPKAEFGNEVLVFMVRGLVTKWKQSIGYVVTNGATPAKKIHELLMSLLGKLKDIGLRVKVLICDQGTNNQSLFNNHLHVNRDQPWFDFEEEKVYTMCDTPHLLKNTRNNLRKHDYVIGEERVQWRHLVQLFEYDVSNILGLRIVPKLSHNHVYTPPLKTMKVKYASQVFSHTVIAALKTCSAAEDCPVDKEAVSFARFAETMDELFDTFNSSKRYDSKVAKCQFSGQGRHLEILEKARNIFEKIQVLDGDFVCKRPPCFNGWLMNIQVLPLIYECVRVETGLRFLRTRSLQQDCLENCFAVIRQSCGFNANPTAQQFRFALDKHTMVSSVLDLSHPESANCERDAAQHLLAIGTTDKTTTSTVQETHEARTDTAPSSSTRPDSAQSSTQENILFYVTGSWLYKFLSLHRCEDCKINLLAPRKQATEHHETFTFWKSYGYDPNGDKSDFGCLKIPDKNFYTDFMIPANDVLCEYLETKIQDKEVCRKVEKIIWSNTSYSFEAWTDDCIRQFRAKFLSLFVRSRLIFILKTSYQLSSWPRRPNGKRIGS